MWKLIKFLFVLLLGAIGTVLGIAAIMPEDYRVSSATMIDAPPAAVFAQVNELKNWEKWQPFLKMDPETVAKYSGPAAGEGAEYHWTGKQTGEGKMKIVRSRQDSLVDLDLHFLKPMEGKSTAQFTFIPVDGRTQVEWSMTGKSDFTHKLMSILMCMDRGMSQVFGQGLADLKRVVEGRDAPAAAATGTPTGTAPAVAK